MRLLWIFVRLSVEEDEASRVEVGEDLDRTISNRFLVREPGGSVARAIAQFAARQPAANCCNRARGSSDQAAMGPLQSC